VRRLIRLLLVVLILVLAFVFLVPPFWQLVYPYQYREIIIKNAILNDLDPLLVATVIRVESSFRPRAVSPQGAIGLMQVMPATGAWAAAQMGVASFYHEQLFDPEINIAIGTWYLRHLKDQFKGDLAVTLAAYNGGRGNVARWLQEATWTGKVGDIGQIPFAETRNYVWRVLSFYKIYQGLYPK